MKRIIIMFATCYIAVASYAQEVIDYGIVINNIAITSENADSVIGPRISGLIKYDAGSNTLTLCDASFMYIASSRTDLLNIHIIGNNYAWSMYSTAISCQGDLHVKGSGHLQAIVYEADGPCNTMEINGSLTISDNSIIETYHISVSNTLSIDNSVLQAISIQADNIELIGCKQVCDNPIIYCPENDDAQFYGLWFGEMPITTYNADNIAYPRILSGKASYDYLTNTLSLNNISIDEMCAGGYYKIIKCDNDNLNIQLDGDNTLYGSIYGKNVYVSGDGFMEIYAIEGSPFWISNLVLEGGCEFASSTSAQSGDIHINSLTVNNSTFRFLLNSFDLYIHYLNLINAAIEDNPVIIYDPETGHFTVLGDYNAELVIKPTGNSAIRDLSGDNHNAVVIYDLQGRRVAEPTQPGIYIRDGKKVVIK